MMAPFAGRQMLVWVSDAGNFGCVLAYCMVSVSFLILRKKEPTLPRPYKVRHGMIAGSLAVLMSGIMLILYIVPTSGAALAPQEWGIAGGWFIIGIFFLAGCKAKYGEKFGYYAPLHQAIEKANAEPGEAAPAPVYSVEAAMEKAEAAGAEIPAMATDFSYFLPVHLHFGAGKTAEIGKLAAPYGKKALIVTVVIALGGGSVMDCAKAIAFMAENEGSVSDYIFGRKTGAKALPLILVPTTCGTGSESNGFAVLTDPETGDKKSLRTPAIVAKASIVDPELMKTMPKKVLASVGFDALCHCIEAYTARRAQPLTDALALYAIPLIADNLVKLYKGEGDDESWAALTLGSTIGGMVINTAGVTLAHGMEHPVSGKCNAVHGAGLAALTPVVIDAEYRGNRVKFGRVARILGGFTAEDCAEKIRTLLEKIDLKVNLTDLGIRKEDIPWLTENCCKGSAGNLANTPGTFTKEEISSLYEAAL